MAPSLIASYGVNSGINSPNTDTLTTPSFTPSNGEVIVVKLHTWEVQTMGTPTGGGQTYTSRIARTNPNKTWNGIYTTVISGSPGPMTISSTPSGSCEHVMVVERWSGAQLDPTPATAGADGGSTQGAPSVNITTEANGSVVTWVSGDWLARSPAGRSYLLGATETYLFDDSGSNNTVSYSAYASVATAGTVAMGMSAPSNQLWNLVGIEVQAASGEVEPAEGSIDAGIGYDVALTGVRGSAGQLDTAVDYDLDLSGSRESAGQINLGLGYNLELAGARDAAGTLAAGIGWDIELVGHAPSVSGAEGDLQLGVDYQLQLAGARDAFGVLGLGVVFDIELVGTRPSAGDLQFELGYEPALVGPAAPGGSAHFSPRASPDAGDGSRTGPKATWAHRQAPTATGR